MIRLLIIICALLILLQVWGMLLGFIAYDFLLLVSIACFVGAIKTLTMYPVLNTWNAERLFIVLPALTSSAFFLFTWAFLTREIKTPHYVYTPMIGFGANTEEGLGLSISWVSWELYIGVRGITFENINE